MNVHSTPILFHLNSFSNELLILLTKHFFIDFF